MSHPTSPEAERDEQIRKIFNLSREEYLRMDETEFRARFRERAHHTLEIQTYSALYKQKTLSVNQTKTLENLITIWRERGIPEDKPDFVAANRIVNFAKQAAQGDFTDLSVYAPHSLNKEEQALFESVIRERRSVRHWTEEEVPDSILDKIMAAASWAAHSCNLQSLRYVVIRESTSPGLFLGGDIEGGPVHILFLQDTRVYKANPYNPERNQLLDVGAAAQNAVLEAHALGLGAVWLTFTEVVKKRLEARLKLPEYIRAVTYIDLGWPDQTPAPLLRLGLDETVLARI